MAADINTQLQNITTDVTAISNLVNRLVTIFSGGGVQNPDLAVLKSEVQSWVTSNFVKPSAPDFKREIVVYSGNPNIRARINLTKTALESDATYRALSYLFEDSSATTLAAVQYGVANSYSALRFVSKRYSNSYELGIHEDVNGSYAYCSTATNMPGTALVNKAYLDNITNSVVHKSGEETLTGKKTFNGGINVVTIERSMTYAKGDTLPSGAYYAHNFLSVDKNGGTLAGLQTALSQNGVVDINLLAFPYVANSTAKKVVFSVNPNGSGVFAVPVRAEFGGNVTPSENGSFSLGGASFKWSAVYATNATIQTSDERVKTEITDIPEVLLDAWEECGFKQFKLRSAVDKKGPNARLHFGGIAQQYKAVLESKGIDPTKYGFFCFDKWEDEYKTEMVEVKPPVYGMVKVVDKPEVKDLLYDDDGKMYERLISPEESHMEQRIVEEAVYEERKIKTLDAGEQYSLRYEELLVLEAAYQRRRADKLEKRISDLEAKIK